MGFVWVHAESFLHGVASPFHFFVTIARNMLRQVLTGHTAGLGGQHVTGINTHNHAGCTAECMIALLLLIVAVLQARPV